MLTADQLRERLKGLIVPMVTPFDPEGRLALSAVHRVIHFLLDGEVDGIIPGDLVGEFHALTLEERRILLRESVQAAKGRMLVIGLTADPSLGNAIELARFAREVGADAIKLALPYPYVPPPSAIFEYFRKIIEEVADMPFLVESSEQVTLPLSLIAELCRWPNFVGLEELGTDLGRLDRLFHEFSSRLIILPSGEAALLFLSLMGAPGLIAAEPNFAPAFMRAFLSACQTRDLDRALDLFGKRRRYRDLFRASLAQNIPMFTPYAKAAMELLGLPVGKPRPPFEILSAEERGRLREVLRKEFGLSVE